MKIGTTDNFRFSESYHSTRKNDFLFNKIAFLLLKSFWKRLHVVFVFAHQTLNEQIINISSRTRRFVQDCFFDDSFFSLFNFLADVLEATENFLKKPSHSANIVPSDHYLLNCFEKTSGSVLL